MTSHNLNQRRARLLREISHFAERVAATADPTTPRERAAHTTAARCLAERAKQLAALPWRTDE